MDDIYEDNYVYVTLISKKGTVLTIQSQFASEVEKGNKQTLSTAYICKQFHKRVQKEIKDHVDELEGNTYSQREYQ